MGFIVRHVRKRYSPADYRLDRVLPGVVFELDVTRADCYPGSGQTLANRTPYPADDSAKTAHDFALGADVAAGGTDPTFTGTAGAPDAYVGFGGAQWLSKIGAAGAVINAIHRTDVAQDFTLVAALRLPTAINVTHAIAGTYGGGGANHGLAFVTLEAGKLQLLQRNGASWASVSSIASATPGSDVLVGVARVASTGAIRFWVNSFTSEATTLTFGASTAAATLNMAIGRAGVTSGGFMGAGGRLYACALADEAYTDAQMAEVFRVWSEAHARVYGDARPTYVDLPDELSYVPDQPLAAAASMAGVTTLVEWNARRAASHSGSPSQVFAARVLNSAYNFNLGLNNQASAEDPVFNGTANTAGAYFGVDGGQWFTLVGGNPTLINRLHRTGANAQAFTLVAVIRTPSVLTAEQHLIGTAPAIGSITSGAGVALQLAANKLRLIQANGTTSVTVTSNLSLSASTVYVLAASYTPASGQVKLYINSEIPETFTTTFTTGDANALGLRVARSPAGGASLINLSRVYGLFMMDATATAPQIGSLFDYCAAEFPVTYEEPLAYASGFKTSGIGSIIEWNARRAAGYPGIGQFLTPRPADAAWNLTLGATDGAQADDPTFTGTADTKGAYFACDGGDFFRVFAANPTLADRLHRTGANAQAHTMAVAIRTPASLTTFQNLIGTCPNAPANGAGVGLQITNGAKLRVNQMNTSATAIANSAASVPTSTSVLLVYSYNPSNSQVKIYVNSRIAETFTLTFGTHDAAAGVFCVGRATNGGNVFIAGTRFYGAFLFSAVLTDSQIAALYDYCNEEFLPSGQNFA